MPGGKTFQDSINGQTSHYPHLVFVLYSFSSGILDETACAFEDLGIVLSGSPCRLAGHSFVLFLE